LIRTCTYLHEFCQQFLVNLQSSSSAVQPCCQCQSGGARQIMKQLHE
jgi:hypothetical protein